jgi:hypothetical protein
MIEATEGLRQALQAGEDPAAALANSLLHLSRNGELTSDDFERLAEQSGLSDDRLQDVKDTLKDYASSGKEAEVTTEELEGAFGDAKGATEIYAGGIDSLTESSGDLEDAMEDTTEALEDGSEEAGTLAERLINAQAAQESLSAVMNAAASPVFDAANAVSNLSKKQAELTKLEDDGKKGTQEWNEAQLDLASAVLETQGKLDTLDPQTLQDAMAAIATALGITTGEAEDLLEELGILDGKKVVAVVEVKAPVIHYKTLPTGEVVPSQVGSNVFAHGGIARSKPGGIQGTFAEAGDDEMITPLNERGLRFLVEAMRRAGLGGDGGESGPTYHFDIHGSDVDAEELANRIEFKRKTAGI